MNNKKRSKKWVWIGGAVALLAVLAIALTTILGNGAAQDEAGTGEVVTAFIGNLSASATARSL